MIGFLTFSAVVLAALAFVGLTPVCFGSLDDNVVDRDRRETAIRRLKKSRVYRTKRFFTRITH